MTGQSVHANCLVVGTRGILIQGESGSGKSELTDTLITAARVSGNLGVLVADDRVVLSAERGQLVARAPGSILGLMEVRGAGVQATEAISAAKVHLVVSLRPIGTMERLPDNSVTWQNLETVSLPALTCPANRPDVSLRLLRWGLRTLFPASPDYI